MTQCQGHLLSSSHACQRRASPFGGMPRSVCVEAPASPPYQLSTSLMNSRKRGYDQIYASTRKTNTRLGINHGYKQFSFKRALYFFGKNNVTNSGHVSKKAHPVIMSDTNMLQYPSTTLSSSCVVQVLQELLYKYSVNINKICQGRG